MLQDTIRTLLSDLNVKVMDFQNCFFTDWVFWLGFFKTHIFLSHDWILLLALLLDIGPKLYLIYTTRLNDLDIKDLEKTHISNPYVEICITEWLK